MRKLLTLSLVLPLFVLAACNGSGKQEVTYDANTVMEDLSFIEGEWDVQSDWGPMYERWQRDEATGAWLGEGGFYDENGEAMPNEEMHISATEDKVYLVVAMDGTETRFELVSAEGNEYVFERSGDEFPKQIIYGQGTSGQVYARIEGMEEGKEAIVNFKFREPVEQVLPSLGEQAIISIGTLDFAASLEFWTAIGFEVMAQENEPYPWAQLFDGAIGLMISNDGLEYIGMTYFSDEVATKIAALQEAGNELDMKNTNEEGELVFGVFDDPDGHSFALIAGLDESWTQPELPAAGSLGDYGEYAVPVADFATSARYYQSLGFEKLSESDMPYPWGIFSDGKMVVGIHQTTDFTTPLVTYYSTESEAKINELQEMGMDVEEFMGPGNAILTTPEGHKLAIFYGDMSTF